MTRRHVIAVAIALATMLAALAQPLWIRATGDEVALEIRPVDPLSLFRGNYVDLTYDVDIAAPAGLEFRDIAYVVFDDSRPANPVRVQTSLPSLGPGETCIRGEVVGGGDRVEFPQLEQYFVTPEEGAELEQDLSSLVGVIKTTSSCRAILISLEPE